MFRLFTIRITFPALDRLVDFLEAAQQAEIDTLTDEVAALTTRLQRSQEKLQSQIDKEKP